MVLVCAHCGTRNRVPEDRVTNNVARQSGAMSATDLNAWVDGALSRQARPHSPKAA